MKHSFCVVALLATFVLGSGTASATIIQTFGSGSAVSTVNASADFEDAASLGVTYSEGGMTFTRVGISTNNNSCGFAGCTSNFAAYGFVGNYFYGARNYTIPESYIQIDMNGGQNLNAIEFLFGWGPSSHVMSYARWQRT